MFGVMLGVALVTVLSNGLDLSAVSSTFQIMITGFLMILAVAINSWRQVVRTVPEPLLTLDGVSKRFGATRAVSAVSLALHPGKIHALVGENGAGKSTIVRIIAGAVSPDTGTIMIGGKAVAFRTPADALRAGIGTSYQDRALIPGMSVSDNALGRETRRFGLISGGCVKESRKEVSGRGWPGHRS